MAPARTPEAIARQIGAAADKALDTPKIQEQLVEMGCDRLAGGPDLVRQLTRAEYNLSGDLIRRLNIRPS